MALGRCALHSIHTRTHTTHTHTHTHTRARAHTHQHTPHIHAHTQGACSLALRSLAFAPYPCPPAHSPSRSQTPCSSSHGNTPPLPLQGSSRCPPAPRVRVSRSRWCLATASTAGPRPITGDSESMASLVTTSRVTCTAGSKPSSIRSGYRSCAPARCRACTSSASIPRTSATSNDTSTKCDLE